jgi:hypothetical protein
MEEEMFSMKFGETGLIIAVVILFVLMALLFSAAVWLSVRLVKGRKKAIKAEDMDETHPTLPVLASSFRRALWVGVPQMLIAAAVIITAQLTHGKPQFAIFMGMLLAVLVGLVAIWRVYRTHGAQTMIVWSLATLLQVLVALPILAGFAILLVLLLMLIFPPVF